jgi:hypothetical protein
MEIHSVVFQLTCVVGVILIALTKDGDTPEDERLVSDIYLVQELNFKNLLAREIFWSPEKGGPLASGILLWCWPLLRVQN